MKVMMTMKWINNTMRINQTIQANSTNTHCKQYFDLFVDIYNVVIRGEYTHG